MLVSSPDTMGACLQPFPAMQQFYWIMDFVNIGAIVLMGFSRLPAPQKFLELQVKELWGAPTVQRLFASLLQGTGAPEASKAEEARYVFVWFGSHQIWGEGPYASSLK